MRILPFLSSVELNYICSLVLLIKTIICSTFLLGTVLKSTCMHACMYTYAYISLNYFSKGILHSCSTNKQVTDQKLTWSQSSNQQVKSGIQNPGLTDSLALAVKYCMIWEVPQNTITFDTIAISGSLRPQSGSLICQKDPQNSAKPSSSWLECITVEGYRVKSAQERSTQGKVQRP